MNLKNILIFSFITGMVFFYQSSVSAAQLVLEIDGIYTIPPKQVIKEVTASHYIFLSENDFDRDGVKESIISAHCVERFCENYIFKHLNNKRYQYLGVAKFQEDMYELIWKEKNAVPYPDILFFELQNVGQGCLGRYQYVESKGYELNKQVCRLPRMVADLLNTYAKDEKSVITPSVKIKDPDFIDFSNIKYDDKPEDFFPDEEIKKD